MNFIDINDYDGRTEYNAPLPPDLLRLLLPGFSYKYVTGPWGWYLSQWIESDDFTFWIQYIYRNYKGKMYAQVDETIYALHHLLSGRALGSLNGGQPVKLSFDRSHFFVIPGGCRQEVEFDKGMIVSMHSNFKRDYINRKKSHYPALQPILQQYDADPNNAFHEVSVIHDHLLEHPWGKILETLPSVPDPILYLDAQVLVLLRIHYEALAHAAVLAKHDLALGTLTPQQFKAVQHAAQVMGRDIAVAHNAYSLSRLVNLNVYDLKRLFRQVHGKTINQYQFELKMNFAEELVCSTDKSIKDIAGLCGFKNVSHFVQLFRRQYGITPIAYRHRRFKKGV